MENPPGGSKALEWALKSNRGSAPHLRVVGTISVTSKDGDIKRTSRDEESTDVNSDLMSIDVKRMVRPGSPRDGDVLGMSAGWSVQDRPWTRTSERHQDFDVN